MNNNLPWINSLKPMMIPESKFICFVNHIFVLLLIVHFSAGVVIVFFALNQETKNFIHEKVSFILERERRLQEVAKSAR